MTRSPRQPGADVLVLGAAQWGMPYGIANRTGPPSDDELRSLLDVATDAGVAWIDTAAGYHDSEVRIGALAPPAMKIVTKTPTDLEVDGVAKMLATRCERLRRASLDVLLLHRAGQRLAFGGALWTALLEHREAGRIARLGISALDPDEAFEAIEQPHVEVVQVATSAVDQRLHRAGFFASARRVGVETHVRSTLLQGALMLSVEELPAHLQPLRPCLRLADELCESLGCSRLGVWLMAALAAGTDRLVIGAERAAQIEAQLGAIGEVSVGDVQPLLEALPELSVDVLDPSRWPATT